MLRKGKSSRGFVLSMLGLVTLVTLMLSVNTCTKYNPALYPSYDVLNPGPEVRANPLGLNEDGYWIVNQAYLDHRQELWREVIKLRKELGR